ncbi:hypothetical protein EDC39_10329 [Geothermobacter ehrlichii]|uniref:Uncharacterized protein n=1 Tax=Geothermobacter ehrlichii TaxID=213224 RepID=A0A5D3WL76_9BACT|nr:hypothetical protein [Geothermobacter ehrlichii]TYO99187.1 hypothetical protein EDC39_10329 [Geothermobacter ehrlichii]
MTACRRILCYSLLAAAILFGSPQPLRAAESGCSEAVAKIDAQNSKLSRDLRRIQREIAALRADLDKPGMQEIFGGIGYIFGLFGVAFFVAARRK